MRYYIASRFSRRHYLRHIREEIHKLGHEVSSTWLDEELDYDSLTGEQKEKVALRDEQEIKDSGVLLLDAMEPLHEGSGGGREDEYGFARGRGMCTVRIGPAHNPFHNAANYCFRDWTHFLEYLTKEGVLANGERRKEG